MKRYGFHISASREYSEAAIYYSDISPELGGRFHDEIERLIMEIRRQPDRFRLFASPVRRHFSTVFPFAILYLDRPEEVWIIAVMNMRRRPGYWRNRIG